MRKALIRLPLLGALCVGTLAGGCGASQPTVVAANLPAYSPQEAALFDDSASPAIFGVIVGAQPPSKDPKLAERSQRADSVFRAKIATVTAQGEGAYLLVIRPLEDALAGQTQTEPIDILVPQTAPAFPFVRAKENAIVGKTVVFFFRRYNADGEVAIHWRAEPDTDEVRAAVKDAGALAELGL